MAQMERIAQQFNRYTKSQNTWYDKTLRRTRGSRALSYFSAEFGLTECMPIYAGGHGSAGW